MMKILAQGLGRVSWQYFVPNAVILQTMLSAALCLFLDTMSHIPMYIRPANLKKKKNQGMTPSENCWNIFTVKSVTGEAQRWELGWRLSLGRAVDAFLPLNLHTKQNNGQGKPSAPWYKLCKDHSDRWPTSNTVTRPTVTKHTLLS